MTHLQSYNTAFMRQVFSPRSEMSLYMNDIQKNKINLIINIDKQKLQLLKKQFDHHDNKMDKINFLTTGFKVLNDWEKDIPYRQSRLIMYLISLFNEIGDTSNKPYITWQQFNNLIIEKALNLKFLQTQDDGQLSKLKSVQWQKTRLKLQSPIIKLITISKYKKLGYLCQQSNKIQFINMVSTNLNYRPVVLERQDLVVEKSLVKRIKNQRYSVLRTSYKKQVVVSSFPVIFLDMLYICNEKYQMLMTSSTDGYVRGWDINMAVPGLMRQPENDQQKMIHQFPVQIPLMVWDEVNQILYCAGKNGKIYFWLIKTDTQKQLSDAVQGHQVMISAMMMIPKLQFLVTGDENGKLILWDTISMNRKFKYQEHTRMIVSICFHQELVLLFSASFDHSICVWNPYIGSLIHKISCNLNVLQVHIIKGTNYLAALDMGSNLKIREIKKFTPILSFTVDRHDEFEMKVQANNQILLKIYPTCMTIFENRFFFGGHSIKCMQFNQNDALTCQQFFPSIIRYSQEKLKLYVVIKNNILIWDLLTGQLYDILSNQSEQQITSMILIHNSTKFVIGDSEGSIYLRNIESGVKIARIHKSDHKISVNHLVAKRGGIWNQSVIIGIYHDCQIIVFTKDQSNDYIIDKNFNIKKYFPNVSILTAQYEEHRNLLIISTNKGDIICMDIDKNRIANHIQPQNFQCIKFIIKYDIPCLIMFGKNEQILGMFLPPHSKKFKTSCNAVISSQEPQRKVVSIAMAQFSERCFIGYEDYTICQLLVPQKLLNTQTSFLVNSSQKPITKIIHQWQLNLQEVPKDMILITQEKVLAVILFMKNITLISVQYGEIINVLPSFAKLDTDKIFYGNPLFYYNNTSINLLQKHKNIENEKKEKEINHQIYLSQTKKYYPIDPSSKLLGADTTNSQLRIFHDPYYLYDQYLTIIKDAIKKPITTSKSNSISSYYHQPENEKIVWNRQWNVFPEFRDRIEKEIMEIVELKKEIETKEQKIQIKIERNNSEPNFQNKNKASQVQKKWKQLKDYMEDEGLLRSTNPKLPGLPQKEKKQEKVEEKRKKHKQIIHEQKIIQKQQSMEKHAGKFPNVVKHKSLQGSSSSPLIRLGLALQKVNLKDERAVKFIKLGEKQSIDMQKSLKFPKIVYKYGIP